MYVDPNLNLARVVVARAHPCTLLQPRFVLTLSPQKMDLAFVRRSTSDGA
jgi:hypothetical protein